MAANGCPAEYIHPEEDSDSDTDNDNEIDDDYYLAV
jgi:hypothetical protein